MDSLIMLMVLFSSPDIPQPHQIAGMAPRPQPNMEVCLTRRTFMQANIETQLRPGVRARVFCVEFRAVGYAEAVDTFSRTLGEDG